ncbi:MAG: M23 family metallopeptidase [Candidatus Krumholzibacteria bacterium]|nr:M23 family metallopeptidase [Candidatus Krumholzibacteria bacterium]
MKKRITAIILLILTISPAARAEVYLWPVKGERRLSSSFGEFRDGHYHAGIDLRSYGAIGLPCLAISDGYLSRVKIGPQGYGKALYVKLADGRTAVYAHLDCFNGEIDSIVWHYRVRKGSPWCDITLDDGKYPVSVGDTVCYSGNTGTSAPHLHFEIRDEQQRPINPLEEIYSVPDNQAPIISGLEFIPEVLPGTSRMSLVDGLPFPKECLLRASGREIYKLSDTVHIQGGVKFAVSVWDEQGYGRYRMAPLTIDLYVDGQTVYSIRNSKFSYMQSAEIVLEYDIRGKGSAGRYTLLFRKKGNTRTDRNGPGMIHSIDGVDQGLRLSAGLHRCEIVTGDASGNYSRAVFNIELGSQPIITRAERLEAAPEVVLSAVDPDGKPLSGHLLESLDGGGTWAEMKISERDNYGTASVSDTASALYRFRAVGGMGASAERWFSAGAVSSEQDGAFFEILSREMEEGLYVDCVSDAVIMDMPVLTVTGSSGTDTITVFRTDAGSFSSVVHAGKLGSGPHTFRVLGSDHRGFSADAAKVIDIYPLSSGERAEIVVGDSIRAVLRAPSVRGKVVCLVGDVSMPGPAGNGLRAVSGAFSIRFMEPSLRRRLVLEAEMERRTGLYIWKKDKGWRCVGIPAMESDAVMIGRPGTYVFLRDGIPPVIKHAALEKNHGGSSFFRNVTCTLPVIEDGSGIDPYSTEAAINGEPVVCEWDGLRDRLVIPLPVSMAPGNVTLEVSVSDHAGNRTAQRFGFVIQ